MTEIFRSTRKCRTFEAFLHCLPEAPSEAEAPGPVNGTKGSERR
jgi:hypothetical protein